MIDNFSILLSHTLLAWAFWVLVNRPELDEETPPTPDTEPEGFAVKRPSASHPWSKQTATPDA